MAERIAFMIVRGVVALAIVGLAAYCLGQGIHYFTLPRQEANTFDVNILGARFTAGGLGAVIFTSGLALAFIGYKTAPQGWKETASRTTAGPETETTGIELRKP